MASFLQIPTDRLKIVGLKNEDGARRKLDTTSQNPLDIILSIEENVNIGGTNVASATVNDNVVDN